MAASIDSPRQLGRYRVLRLLGEGGMGSVFLAEDTQLGRQVAVKVPHLLATNTRTLCERLLREARAAAAIDHPNICPIYDVGEHQGIPYLVMPFVNGTPLAGMIDPEHPWTTARTLALVHKIALAVGAAHSRNIIHRDLKPGNIMVRSGDDPLVMDFGLARLTGCQTRALTQQEALGTPAYMAPEQMEDARTVGPTADVYALGVVLYELLTGEPPFGGPLPVLYGRVLHMKPEPPSARRPGLEPWLDAVCLRTLAKSPAERYLSMEAFAQALKPSPVSVPAARKPVPLVVPSLKLHPVPDVELDPGQSRTVEVRVTRQHCAGPVELWLEGQTPGIPVGRSMIAAESDCTTVKLRAGTQTTPGLRTIRLHARAAQIHTEIPVQVIVGRLPLPGEIVNSLGMNFLLIPAGRFCVEAPKEENPTADANPWEVEITRPFYVGVSEITKGQYERVMGRGHGRGCAPPEVVSWADAERFCKRLSAMEQERRTARSYRLPTEAEWAFACRDEAATSKPFQFGGSYLRQANIDWCCHLAAEKNYLVRTSGIAAAPANVWRDADRWGWQTESVKDTGEGRVLHGGSWLPVGWYCHSAYRGLGRPGCDVYAGFRLVCVVRTA